MSGGRIARAREKMSKDGMAAEAAAEAARRERSHAIAVAMRETAYALGHGSEVVTYGSASCPKRELTCEGDYHSTTVRFPDGTYLCSDIGTLMDHMLVEHNGERVEEAEGKVRGIWNASRGRDPELFLDSSDWLECTIALMDGDVSFG